MVKNRLKALLIIEQCNPEWASVPLVGYRFFHEISQRVDVTLVTHERNRAALEKLPEQAEIVYISESNLSKKYHEFVANLAYKGKVIWPLYHALTYPIYAEFNHNVYRQFKDRILSGEFDIVHALTPMMPRYPVKSIQACLKAKSAVPFLLGPVNGGVPFPAGFQETAKKEYANLNFLRAIGRSLIPGYVETYRKATRVLSGSTYTLNLVKDMFQLPDEQVELFYENGILSSFLEASQPAQSQERDTVNLLFAGRLVPYKGADMLIEAISRLEPAVQSKVRLTIVGDGSERAALEQQTQALNLSNLITFTGWVNPDHILDYYRQSDLFCFPSVREFGGAVVLEAMACGLPCIVANNGGIGEYVTDETGFRIEPTSREYLTAELAAKIKILVEDAQLRQQMSQKAIERVREFTWERKAEKIVEIYQSLAAQNKSMVWSAWDGSAVPAEPKTIEKNVALGG